MLFISQRIFGKFMMQSFVYDCRLTEPGSDLRKYTPSLFSICNKTNVLIRQNISDILTKGGREGGKEGGDYKIIYHIS